MTYKLKLASIGAALALGAATMVPAAVTANAGGYHNRDRVVVVEHGSRRDFRDRRSFKRWKRAERSRWRRIQRRHAKRHHHAPAPRYYVKKDKFGPKAVAVGLGALILGLIIADAAHHDHHR